jgi:hypothetical protein
MSAAQAKPWNASTERRPLPINRGAIASVRRLITPSARSNVPPFIVMDVVAAAARIEAGGGRVIHMEVGQPAAPAPATAIAAAAAVARRDIGYTEALGIPSLRATMRSVTASPSTPAG